MLSIINFAIDNYGWSLEYVLDTSIVFIMLLMRQKVAAEGKGGLSLIDQEKIDSISSKSSWDEIVAENHRKLMKSMMS